MNKLWGNTKCVISNEIFEIHKIEVNKNFFCSKHYHKYKNNIFYVEKGSLLIEKWEKEKIEKFKLGPGDSLEIKNCTFHRFLGLEDSIAFEIYYFSIKSEDIVRE